MHRTHSPQVLLKWRIWHEVEVGYHLPRSTHEPWLGVRMLVFLPNQPTPARSAAAVVHWAVVDEDASLYRPARNVGQGFYKRPETLLHDVMVVVAQASALSYREGPSP